MKSQLKQTEHQKIMDKLHGELYKVINKAGFEHVEHGERFLYASSEYKGRKIEIKIIVS